MTEFHIVILTLFLGEQVAPILKKIRNNFVGSITNCTNCKYIVDYGRETT